MGTDWHPHLETQQDDGTWQPTWKPVPHPEWWYEDLLARKEHDGSLALMWPNIPDEKLWEKGNAYYRNLPIGEIVETIQEADIYHLWREETGPKQWAEVQEYIRMNQIVPMHWHSYCSERFASRDYNWFSLFGLRTNKEPTITWNLGIPDDVSSVLRRKATRWKADAHTVGHIMVKELLDNPKLKGYNQTTWLKQYVENPEKTRLIFWFDN